MFRKNDNRENSIISEIRVAHISIGQWRKCSYCQVILVRATRKHNTTGSLKLARPPRWQHGLEQNMESWNWRARQGCSTACNKRQVVSLYIFFCIWGTRGPGNKGMSGQGDKGIRGYGDWVARLVGELVDIFCLFFYRLVDWSIDRVIDFVLNSLNHGWQLPIRQCANVKSSTRSIDQQQIPWSTHEPFNRIIMTIKLTIDILNHEWINR